MFPDHFRERDLAAHEIVAEVRSDGRRAVVEMSINDLDWLIASMGGDLCDACGSDTASLCGSCAAVTRPDDVELCDVCWRHDAKVCTSCAAKATAGSA